MAGSKKISKKHQPHGFQILYEDEAIIVGNKSAGILTVGALYDREHTVHHALNLYVRKGNSRSHKRVFVVHRLDRETSGVLIFAKTPEIQEKLKNNWKDAAKIYYALVHGQMSQKTGTITSYLQEDDDYVVHSTEDKGKGKLAHTAYTAIQETSRFSLLKINLLTGRKNQIRVHLADHGHPIVGDLKYGKSASRYPRLCLHALSIAFPHPMNGKRLFFETSVPEVFRTLIGLGPSSVRNSKFNGAMRPAAAPGGQVTPERTVI